MVIPRRFGSFLWPSKCIVPERGVTADAAWKDELWARFFTAAPARQPQYVERYEPE